MSYNDTQILAKPKKTIVRSIIKLTISSIIIFICLPLKSIIGETFFGLLVLLPITIHLFIVHNKLDRMQIIHIILLYFLFFYVGFEGIWAFIGHFFMANQVAMQIGWGIGSPFQTEMAFSNLAYGILGILCIWIKKRVFWLSAIICTSILHFGAAYTHINDIIVHGNYAKLNTGYLLWINDILIPFILIILISIYFYFTNINIKSKNNFS